MGAMDCVSLNTRGSKMTPTESTEVFTIDAYTMSGSRRDLESQSTLNSAKKSHSAWWHVLIDVPLLSLVLGFVGLYELAIIPTHKSGFFCNDPKLSYPFSENTVSTAALIIPILLIPIILFYATEMILYDAESSYRSRASQTIRNTAILYRSYVYGLSLNLIMFEVIKGITGMPRPNFFAFCKPDTAVNCTTGEYISAYECTSSQGWWKQNDSYHSFPSGHSSLSVYFGLFLAWYLQRRAFSWSRRTVLLVPFLQVLCACYATLCSLSRISDHMHHWWDVLVGAGLGLATMWFAVFCLCDNFSVVRKNTDNSRHT